MTFLVAADVRRLIIQHGFLADQSLLTSATTILKQALSSTLSNVSFRKRANWLIFRVLAEFSHVGLGQRHPKNPPLVSEDALFMRFFRFHKMDKVELS
jgi:hypothetical protein